MNYRVISIMGFGVLALIVINSGYEVYADLSGPDFFDAPQSIVAFNSMFAGAAAAGMLAINVYFAKRGLLQAFGLRHIGRKASSLLLVVVPPLFCLFSLAWYSGVGPSWTSAVAALFYVSQLFVLAMVIHLQNKKVLSSSRLEMTIVHRARHYLQSLRLSNSKDDMTDNYYDTLSLAELAFLPNSGLSDSATKELREIRQEGEKLHKERDVRS